MKELLNTVIQGDCMEYMKTIPDKYFELAICDPPYGLNAAKFSNCFGLGLGYTPVSLKLLIGKKGSGKLKDRIINTADCTWDKKPPSKEYFIELFRVSKNQIIWGGNYFGLPPTRCFVIWDKEQSFLNFSACEYAWTSFDFPSKIFRYSNRGFLCKEKDKIHPTQKPVALYAYLLDEFAKQGDKILDTHLGSGSSRIAAYMKGFDFYGIEIDKGYFDLQEKRFKSVCLNQYCFKNITLIQKTIF
ncbi:MAG: site-specific DNA-methyltransferase [Prevotellaceae bacterium]|jgi:site-specific DNA-methyltransferase (adenine-specific)|nr:site-specific DNA-methyltransferase [Prevotellaceae bacterium]